MAKTRCVFLITILIFTSFILQIFSTKFPEFLNEDDLRSMGVKNPQKKVYHPPSVEREPESPPPGYESVESNEMNKNRKPPNGLPIPAVPPPFYTYKNSEFKPMGRGDPKDQNIVQQMDDEDGNALFPRPDGLPLSGSDSIDLNLLEKRLTDTNKWDEFRNLVAKEQQKLKQGETMENWEADAHMWASYSRQLVERDKIAKRRAQEEERKDAERKAARQNQHEYLNPSAGMEQYWTSNDNDKKSSDPRYEMDAVNKKMLETLSRLPHSQSDSEELSLSKNAQLWHAMKQGIHLPMPPPKLWTRRQYDGMPPIYYKDRPNESRGAISTGRDDRYLTPEQRSQESPDYDMGPDTSQLSQTFEKPRITFDENVNEDNVPYGDGKIPGVGSEADFPNGYRPNYGDNSQISPGFYQMPQSYSSGYPEAQKNPFIKTQPKTRSNKAPPQIPPKNKAAVGYPDDFKHALRMGGPRFQPGPGSESDFSEGSGPDNFKHALRMGGPHSQPGLGSESNFPEGSGPDNFKHALRMGGPRFQPGPGSELNVPEGSGPDNYKHAHRMGGPRFQPGPGSESDFSEGFHPKIAGGNMERGVPSGNGLHRPPRLNNQFQGMGQRGPPPGWHSEGKAGWKPDKSWGSSRFSPPGEPDYQPLPESERLQPNFPREFPVKGKDGPAALRDGADDTAITFQGQNSPGGDADLGQAGFKPRQPNLPTGYNLLQIALNKTADEDQMIRAAPTTEPSTTPKHPPTKEERIQQLQQHDDFGAPIRWVPLTSPDTSDGLAKVTDKETHKNQQFIIEGVLYVPVVDENVARLGLTTEDYQETTTQLPTLTPKNDSSIKTILRSMNLNKSSELEWLAMETVLGPKQIYPAQCEAESCQARCHKPKCDSKCRGEMCASGCVGVGCNANCNGPACFSMCIGEKCTAKCEGMNCESRCWGKGCEATCTLLSCIYTVNGETLVTNATFDQLYPNYDNKPKNDGRQAQRLEQPGLDNTKLKNEDYYY
ncbi:unnamed protein product [Spodoptera littoralis]|uniref:Uncharacterized protein n=1 Tax=Spodoptera littoralis TaxID=7109 RepID=A0A9P0IA10_SPOLI|nr:unnamed protein product [Spodoptera littoralis]CAH1642448.1 unnamed protein product [Spodoptera littoralis]